VFDRFARWCSEWTGRGWYFMLYVVGTVVVLGIGWWRGNVMDTMIVWTAALTVTTQLQTVLLQNSGTRDTCEIKAQLKELGRATPGAEDVIEEKR
jgi:low affinity Fe/Cu permease